jgi:thiamine biosynthesis protein ThiS
MIDETKCQSPQMADSRTQTIEIVVNGRMQRVPERLSIEGLLAFLEIDASRVAVELNRAIVRKPEWSYAIVDAGAIVEIVWFVGGG